MTRKSILLKQTRPGETISARHLSQIASSINALRGGIDAPVNQSTVYGEVARTAKTVSIPITSDDPTLTINPLEFEQIETVTLKNGAGEVIVLVFNNPPAPAPVP